MIIQLERLLQVVPTIPSHLYRRSVSCLPRLADHEADVTVASMRFARRIKSALTKYWPSISVGAYELGARPRDRSSSMGNNSDI